MEMFDCSLSITPIIWISYIRTRGVKALDGRVTVRGIGALGSFFKIRRASRYVSGFQ